MTDAAAPDARAGLYGFALSLCTGWAVLGGFVLIGVVAVNLVTILGSMGIGAPFPGDFELTEIGVAVAAFAFLPYCQIAGKNVTADIFTARASQFWLAGFSLLASIVAFAFASILLWRMYAGMLDQREYDYTSAILQIPIWTAFVPCLISLALLAFAALVTLLDAAGRLGRG